MNGGAERNNEIAALVELVKFDYERTLSVIDGLVRVCTAVRALAITVWVGLLAASIEAENVILALIAVIATTLFALLDAYHGWLYAQARERARDMEGLLADRYKCLSRAGDAPEQTQLLTKLRQHKLGQLRNFKKVEALAFYGTARPAFFYRRFYPLLALMAAGVAIAVGIHQAGEDKQDPGGGATQTHRETGTTPQRSDRARDQR